jgi:TRAP-type C4-dicarboxylate transport system substrate-binding protein
MNRPGRIVLFLGCALLLAECSREDRPVRILLREGVVPAGQPVYRTLLKAGEVLSGRTGGRIRFSFVPASADIDSSSQTVCMLSMPSVNGLAEYYRPLGVLEAPYMFRDLDHFYHAIDSPIGRRLLREAEQRAEQHVLDVWHLGVRQVTLRDRPATTPDEFGFVKLRVPPALMSVEVARVLGALPTTITFQDIFVNLRAGTVDGQENPLPTIKAMGFDALCRYLVLTNHVIATTLPTLANYQWAKLSPNDRDLVIQAFRDVRNYNRLLIAEQERRLVAEFERGGMIVLRPEIEPFRRRAEQSWRRFRDVWGDSLVTQIQAIR